MTLKNLNIQNYHQSFTHEIKNKFVLKQNLIKNFPVLQGSAVTHLQQSGIIFTMDTYRISSKK